ncbi:uncharacterized protein LOC107695378 [Sinocyclocheilus anshuiensis]|uniref:uncharacterized protein LOC107695378 n=1 Tax=Sinocyclocheilus anshuiensis TaxID=1608454 RepID=UPI0007B9B042|nr:PREDICTED: uncharacterized protein LOC107695378 [Sinocyclocheilus anshuiensis]
MLTVASRCKNLLESGFKVESTIVTWTVTGEKVSVSTVRKPSTRGGTRNTETRNNSNKQTLIHPNRGKTRQGRNLNTRVINRTQLNGIIIKLNKDRKITRYGHKREGNTRHKTDNYLGYKRAGNPRSIGNFECWEIKQNYMKTKTPGQLFLQGKRPAENVDIMVLETDYSSYATVVFKRAGKITMKLYGRSSEVPDNILEKI